MNGMYVFLDIVERFACGQCGACCSQDWLVTVDEAGYRRNERLFGENGRMDEFRQAFIPLRTDADFGEYARIAKQESGGCWFLNEKMLCRLQQLAGHEHLDTVCQWFPRYPMDTERGIELSLSFSCPVALKMALREEPLRIVRSNESPIGMSPTDFVVHVYPTQQSARSPLRHYFELEGHLIDILQTRTLRMPERLALVRQTLQDLACLTEAESPGEKLVRLERENYAKMDALASDETIAMLKPCDWLLENFFVNFVFRKSIYAKGLEEAGQVLGLLEQRLGNYLVRPSGSGGNVEELKAVLVQQELELNHRGKRKPPAAES